MYGRNFISLCIAVSTLFMILTGCGSGTEIGSKEPKSTMQVDMVSEPNKTQEPVDIKNGKDSKTAEDPKPAEDLKPSQNAEVVNTPLPKDGQDSEPVNDTSGSIKLRLDKNKAEIGEVIKADIVIENIDGFTGYQVNIKYDPKVLQAVLPDSGTLFTNRKMPLDGTILTNTDYLLIPLASNNIEEGILNFGKSYVNLEDYKKSGKPERTGTIAVIGFKVLKKESTYIRFEDSSIIPGGKSGTLLFDWDGKKLSGYKVIQPDKIN
ncbi:MAG: cohesin domain-containing protein [Bacillota bacterium]